MKSELLKQLSPITDEEKRFLSGNSNINRSIYMDDATNVVKSKKLLDSGKLITVRPHTRFVHFPPHKHDYVEVVFMCSGTTTHVVNGKTIKLHEGELLFLGQNSTQEILPADEKDIAINFIILPEFFTSTISLLGESNSPLKDFIFDCLQNNTGSSSYLYFKVADVIPIQNLIENLIWILLNGINYRQNINQATMGLLFLHLLNATEFINYNSTVDGAVIKVLRYIESNYRDANLTRLAEELHYDFYWLSKQIKMKTGKTYTRLLQEKRLSQACYLLRSTGMCIADISASVGYDNQSYFYRLFSSHYGLSPKHYREANKDSFQTN